jgi:hypothetical protein
VRSFGNARRGAGLGFALAILAVHSGASGDPRAPEAARGAAWPAQTEPEFDVVLLISVDGLRSDALVAVPGSLPAFDRLRLGAHTLNARTDPASTFTLPNHTGMLTGRLLEGAAGHAWGTNDEVAVEVTLHSVRGAYVASVFDVVHDRGGFAALLAGKPKFRLYDASFDAQRGAPDALAPDHGPDKLDRFELDPAPAGLGERTLAELQALHPGTKALVFLHFAAPDLAAHARGWDLTKSSPYLKAVGEVDRALGRLLEAIDASDALRGKTAIVLTADHGGGAPLKSHGEGHMWVNYVIPFLVWAGDRPPADLYALNPGVRRDPSLARPEAGASPPPVRNADAANLALDLLGLPPVPGSTVNAAQDLRAVLKPAR